MSDELMELPEGWVLEKIKDLCSFNPKHDREISETLEISFVPMSNVSEVTGTIQTHDRKLLGEVRKGYTHFAEHDVIFAKITPCMENGKVAVARNLINGIACGSTEFHVLRSYGAVIPDYLHSFLRQRSYLDKASGEMTGVVGQRRLPKDFLLETELPLPPLSEQKRIVEAIESLRNRSQKARSALSAIPELCDKFRQSVLAAAFRGDLTADWREQNPDVEPASVLLERIRLERRHQWEKSELEKFKASGKIPKDDSWKAKYKETTGKGSRQLVAEIKAQKYRITDLPENWTVVKLGEIAQLQTGYAFKSNWFVNEGIRLLRGTNIVPSETRWEEVVYLPKEQASEFEEYRLNDGDIVIAMDRPIISTGLKVARLSLSDTPSLLLQRVGRFKIGADISPDFLLGFLNSQLFIAHVQDQATGTQLPHISANDIESAIIPLPPIAEQQEISKLLRIWMQKSSNFTDLVDRIFPAFERIDRSILAKAFRGELVEQDPNDEPASVLLERIRAEREQQAQGKAKKLGKKGQRTIRAE